jgi:phytoene dehydrogenase-like protein
MSESSSADVVIVGAGHNGLVAAGYLAHAGLRVTVVEAREVLGGAAVTEELVPGFRFSSAAVVLHLLWPKIIRDLELARHGLDVLRTSVDRVGIWHDRALVLYPELDRQLAAIGAFSRSDAAGLVALGLRLRRFAALYEPTLLRPPVRLDALRTRFDERDAGMFEELVAGSIGDLVGNYLSSPELQGFTAFPGIVSVDAGPDTPGTAYVFAHHAVGGIGGELGAHAFVRGGMGGVTQALAASARAAGATILSGRAVASVLLDGTRAAGVELADGSTIAARVVVSNADPRRTMLDLVGAEHLEAADAARLRDLDMSGSMGRVHLALRELPRFTAQPHEGSGPADVHRAFSLVGASLEGYRRAHEAQARGELPRDPVLELTTPSASDPSLAPAGMHTATIGVQQLARELTGDDWDRARERFADLVVERLCQFAPNVRDAIVGRAIATPLDLERTFGLGGGNIFHGAMTERQLFERRPLAGWANYRTPPINQLYLCGAGTHPGGAVSGAPGHNAARAILEDWPGAPLSDDDWRARAAATHSLAGASRRGLLLSRAAQTRAGRAMLTAVARRSISRPLVHRLAVGRGVVGDE